MTQARTPGGPLPVRRASQRARAAHNNQPLEKALNHMLSQSSTSNKPNRYMQELDEWTEATIINPLFAVWERQQQDRNVGAASKAIAHVTDEVKKAVRTKVLESYRNGQGNPSKNTGKSYQARK